MKRDVLDFITLYALGICFWSAAAQAAPSDVGTPLLVTFDVSGERFQARVTREQEIRYVEEFVAGRVAARALVGELVLVDAWHLRPESIHFTENAGKECNGSPLFIEQHKHTEGEVVCLRARIVRAERAGQVLRGLYAGRSPY